jgi:hypothetical protein
VSRFDEIKTYFGDDSPEMLLFQSLSTLKMDDFQVVDDETGLQVLNLPNITTMDGKSAVSPSFLNMKSGTLFIRKEYPLLYENMFKVCVDGGSVVCGNPGIGKSVGVLNYILCRSAIEKRYVLFESR